MKTKQLLLIVLLLALLTVGFWLGGVASGSREMVRDLNSQSKMSQIRGMLLLYHDVNGVFPPIKYRPEPSGPMHSWRVLLVPHTTRPYSERYSDYDFTKEWNSPTNLQALDFGPYFIYWNLHDEIDSDTTNYLAVGDDEAWPWEKPMRSWLITKGDDRFLLVEDPDSEIRWMEPKQ